MKCASLLEIHGRPTEFWTRAEWADFRQRVRTALDQEKLPVLAD